MFTFHLDNTKRLTLPAPHCHNGSCRYIPALFRIAKNPCTCSKVQFRQVVRKGWDGHALKIITIPLKALIGSENLFLCWVPMTPYRA